jgi:hypothetical protein
VAAGRCVTEGERPAPGAAEEEWEEIEGSRRFAAADGPQEIADSAAGAAVHPSLAHHGTHHWAAVRAERRRWGGEGRDSAYSASRGLQDGCDIHPHSAAATYVGTSAWHRRLHAHGLHGID